MASYGRPSNGRSASVAVIEETEDESTFLLRRTRSHGDIPIDQVEPNHRGQLKRLQSTWFPREDDSFITPTVRRRIFLFLTEPNSSLGSLIFYCILVTAITVSNIIMILQTMEPWQFTPTDCVTCGGDVAYLFEDDDSAAQDSLLPNCECPPAPKNYTVVMEDYLIYFFAIEWILRVLCYEPPLAQRATTFSGSIYQLVGFLFETTTVLDFWAIFPYFMERFQSNTKGLMSLRLLRLCRVFQLVRLGQFNDTFTILTNVLGKSLPFLKLLVVVLIFGSVFFGSMVYWLEKGEWLYWEETGDFQFVRMAADGVSQEISPFTNVPQGFWWFIVTATTVGYGDTFPTSAGGKAIAVLAMLTGLLVIAFPVSVFSELWQKELNVENEEVKAEKWPEADLDETIEISHKDLRLIREHMQTIEEHQKRIQDILDKFEITS